MYNSKGKTQKAYKLNKAEQNIIPKNCVAVFPLLIVSGSTPITEHGTMPQNLVYDKGSFLFWQEVFDGRKAIKIQWEDAVILNKPEGENYYLADTQVGKYYFGKPISNSTESLEIGEDASYEEFITMRANQTITLRFEFDKSNRVMFDNLKEDLRFVDNDLYKLYLIPEICEGKLMYISDYEEIYNDETGLSWACEITFQSLGNELQKSGKAVEQYPRWSAPGEFYVKPKIEYSTGEKRVKRITIDPKGLHPKPIKYLQVELQGPALTSCVYALGRRQERDETTGKWKIGPSKHLLGSRFITTQPNPLNRTSTPSKNYNCFIEEEITMTSTKDMLEGFTTFSQPLEQQKNGGMISLGNVNEWGGTLANGFNGLHISNLPKQLTEEGTLTINPAGCRWDYYDTNWHPLENFTFKDEDQQEVDYKDYNTNGCVYADENMRYYKTDTMIDIMNKNVFTFNQQPIIPLSMYDTRPLYLRNIPIIGAAANFFNLGDIHLFTNTTNRQASTLIYFGDSDLCAICSYQQKGFIADDWRPWRYNDQKVAFPVNFFGNNETQYNKLGVNSVNTTFCIELTDKISMIPSDLSLMTVDTLWLGQSTDENGTPFYENDPTRTLLANGSMRAIPIEDTNFIIDAVIVQTIFDGKIRLSCYSTEDDTLLIPEWTTTILSNANWQGGAMRDWTNFFLLSNWEERFCRQQDEFTYPLAPRKESEEDKVLDIGLNESFELVNSPGAYKDFPSEWSLTQGLYKNVDRSTYIERNKPFANSFTIQYVSLGVEGVDDRDSFIEYFGNIKPNLQQTQISYTAHDKEEQKVLFNEQFTLIGSFEEGVYSYDFELPILSINNNIEGWKDKELEPWCDEVWEMATIYFLTVGKGKLGTTLKANLHIELTDRDIQITITDKSLMLGWNCHGGATQFRENGQASLYRTTGSISARTNTIKYTINMPQIKFVKRGNGNTLSNKIYGKK